MRQSGSVGTYFLFVTLICESYPARLIAQTTQIRRVASQRRRRNNTMGSRLRLRNWQLGNSLIAAPGSLGRLDDLGLMGLPSRGECGTGAPTWRSSKPIAQPAISRVRRCEFRIRKPVNGASTGLIARIPPWGNRFNLWGCATSK